MNLRIAIGFSLCLMSLTGCPTTEPGTDAGRAADAFTTGDAFTPAVDAPMVAVDAPVASDDAPVVAVDAPMSDAPGAAVTFSTVHASLRTSCVPCHAGGGAGGHNMAAADEMAAFTDSSRVASSAASRVRSGTMPPGGLPEPARTNLANLLDQWVAGGRMR